MSESVETDYFKGFVENKLREWIAHSNYDLIWRHYVSNTHSTSRFHSIVSQFNKMTDTDWEMMYYSPHLSVSKKSPQGIQPADIMQTTKMDEGNLFSCLLIEETPDIIEAK